MTICNPNQPLVRELPQNLVLGSSLKDQLEKIYIQAAFLRTVAGVVYEEPVRTGCATVSLFAGVSNLLSGDYFSGALATAAGVAEFSKLFSDAPSSDLKRAFNDIQADVNMVEALQNANKTSYDVIDRQLQLADDEVKALKTHFDQISKLAGENGSRIKEKKQEIEAAHRKVRDAYQKAEKLFKEAREKTLLSEGHYGQCAKNLEAIQKIAKNPYASGSLEVAISELEEKAKEASSNCLQGNKVLEEANERMAQAFSSMEEARKEKIAADRLTSNLTEEVVISLKNIGNISASLDKCSQALSTAKKELSEILERHNDIMELISELKKDLRKAREEAEKRWTSAEMAAGIGTAACLGVTTGPLPALTAGVSAAYAVRNGSTIFNTASSIYRWAFSIPKILPKIMSPNELFRLDFNESSSGYWGYFVQKRPSATVGMVRIQLEEGEIRELPFNLNQKDRIEKIHVLEFLETLNQKLKEGKLTSERCLSILDQLENYSIDRGSLHTKQTGLIRKDSKLRCILNPLKKLCQKQGV